MKENCNSQVKKSLQGSARLTQLLILIKQRFFLRNKKRAKLYRLDAGCIFLERHTSFSYGYQGLSSQLKIVIANV